MEKRNEPSEIYKRDWQDRPENYELVPPRSARKKIEAMLKAQTESPKGNGVFKLNRREFLRASAITGSIALVAFSGLISVGRKESEAVASSSEGAEVVPLLGDTALEALEAGTVVKVANGAEAIVKLLEAYGVDYIFWLTDDEISAIADKLTPSVIAGKKPIPIMSLHEFGALAMADGYASATEKVGVTFFGANQGPMNAHGAFFNAYYSKRAIVAISALNSSEGLPYVGQYWIDPGDLVREYCKWTNHFPNTENIVGTFIHAFATAASHPQGPVLISTFSNTWHKEMPGGTVTIPDVKRLGPPRASVPDAETLKEAAALLFNANNPIILAGNLGRSDEAFKQLVGLAELLSVPVFEKRGLYTSFPWDHPLHIGFSESAYLKDADVVFAIETTPPAAPATAKVIHLDPDPVSSHALTSANRVRETDVRMLGDPSATIPALMEQVMAAAAKDWSEFRTKTEARYAKWKIEHDKQRAEWKADTEKYLDQKPIHVDRLAYEINKIMDDTTIVYNWSFNSKGRMYKVIHTNKPKSYIYGLGGSHLGQGVYGAIGAAVGRPDRTVISCSGDLEWHMGHGFAALWSAAHHNVPVLFIIENNHCMTTTKSGQMRNKGEGFLLNNWWAQDIFPPMTDFSKQAGAFGIYGECVKEPEMLGPALLRAMAAVKLNKQPAIVDVWTKPLV